MPYRQRNPYPKHSWNHFVWNVYHLLAYQFSRYAVMAWILLVLVVAFSFYKVQQVADQNRKFTVENRHRIADIQLSRIQSCIKIYQSFLEVLSPFYPPKPVRTPAQQLAVQKFEDLVRNKKRKCRIKAGDH